MGNRFRDKVVEEGLDGEWKEEIVQRAMSDSPAAPKRGNRRGKVAKGLAKVLGGDILADKLVLRQIPLLLLCMVFLLLIVGVRYRVESLSRAKMAKEEQINELREKRIRILRSNQETVKISQIAKELKETGVGITSGPPYEI